jgi:hypothetical protein
LLPQIRSTKHLLKEMLAGSAINYHPFKERF